MKKLLVAAIMVVLASPAAFAAIQNVKVSGDITTSYVNNNTFDLGFDENNATGENGVTRQSVFVTQTRLRVDADLSDNVSTEVGLINERAWNAENATSGSPDNYANDTDVQLYLATLTLKQFLYSPLTLEIGRQSFNYGNGLILGNGGAINQGGGPLGYIDQGLTERTAYDGVTATLDYKPLTISLIYFKNAQTLASIDGIHTGDSDQNSDVYGYNANYQLSDPWSTVVEQYLFTRLNGGNATSTSENGVGEAATDKGDTLFVPGLRASTNPTKNLNLQGELAWELGKQVVVTAAPTANDQEAEHRDAMAAQFLATYTLPVLEKYKPSVNASYTYVSGDKNAAENYGANHVTSAKTDSAWDEFNTIQGAGTIYRSLFNMSNESIISAGASVAPLEDLTAAVTWTGLWAIDPYTNSNATGIGNENPLLMYQPNSDGVAVLTPATNKNGYWLGNETDINLTYNYTEDVTFGLNLGWFVPGDVFASSNKDIASQAIANVAVTF
jgi:hypothetical protein